VLLLVVGLLPLTGVLIAPRTVRATVVTPAG
jgi:hypothetical protein